MAGMRAVEELLVARSRPLRHHRHRRRSRSQITIASCCRRSWRATRRSTRSSSIRGAGTASAASPDSRKRRDGDRSRGASGRARGRPRRAYDKLLLATGSKPLAPPIPGLDLPNVRAFRDIADVEAMIGAAASSRRAVVIGGGLLGLEAAWGLKRRGMSVALVHLMPTLMERQLDVAAAELLRRELEAPRHCHFHQRPDRGDRRRRTRRGGRARRRPPHRDGIRRVGHRHSAQYRAGARRGARRQSRYCGRRRYGDERSATSTRSANASSITARCSGWWRRSGTRRRFAARGSPATDGRLCSAAGLHQLEDNGRGRLLRRRARRRRSGGSGDHAARRQARPLQESHPARRQNCRLRALRQRRRTAPGTWN